MTAEPLDLEQLLRVPRVDVNGGLDLDPDGARAAFSWNRSGRWEIYELALDRPNGPRQISSGPGGKFTPRYSPDGRYLAYMVDEDGGENYDLCLFDREYRPANQPDPQYPRSPAAQLELVARRRLDRLPVRPFWKLQGLHPARHGRTDAAGPGPALPGLGGALVAGRALAGGDRRGPRPGLQHLPDPYGGRGPWRVREAAATRLR